MREAAAHEERMDFDRKGNGMTPNEVAIRQSIRTLEEMWQPWPRSRTEAYVLALGDLWPEDVEAGVLATLKDWKLRSFPPPAFVRERAVAHRSSKRASSKPSTNGPPRGPVGWHEAKLPMTAGEDGYLHDADGRYVLADLVSVRAWYAAGTVLAR
jgi:hypothetical protein